MRSRDDDRMIVSNDVPEYIKIGGKLIYKPVQRADGKPEYAVFLRWDDGFERQVFNERGGDQKKFRLLDSVARYHQHHYPEATSVTIGLAPLVGDKPSSGGDGD